VVVAQSTQAHEKTTLEAKYKDLYRTLSTSLLGERKMTIKSQQNLRTEPNIVHVLFLDRLKAFLC